MPRPKDVLTTGDVARICNVAPRTVSKWFDTGKLRGYRIPGSKDRRIPLQQLVRFMKAHGIPLNGLETGAARVLIAENDTGLADLLSRALTDEAGYDVQIARSAFEAGAVADSFKPHVIFMDVEMPGLSGRETLRAIRGQPDLALTKIVALTSALREGETETLKQQGFDAALLKPFEVSAAVKTIEGVLAAEA